MTARERIACGLVLVAIAGGLMLGIRRFLPAWIDVTEARFLAEHWLESAGVLAAAGMGAWLMAERSRS